MACSIISFHAFGFLNMEAPNTKITPGKTCAAGDPNFSKYDYPEHIARCERHVTSTEKARITNLYGSIPKSEWKNYEFDHLIPLCAGGSDDIENVWPQPIRQARQKDVVEDEVCRAMKAGTMTQEEAIQKIWDWFSSEPALN